MTTLKGNAGSEALQLYMRLGGAGAGFNARKVARAVRTAAGRVGVVVDLLRSRRRPTVYARTQRHTQTVRRVVTKARQRRTADVAPTRPRPRLPERGCV